ncbi:hypothetical protein pb186bvf_014785 [Paramecium bursaria]
MKLQLNEIYSLLENEITEFKKQQTSRTDSHSHFSHKTNSQSPQINKYHTNQSPFRQRLQTKQLVHKEHRLRHEQEVKEEFKYSPQINQSGSRASPFRQRLNIKQLTHKDHTSRHLEYEHTKPKSIYQCRRNSDDDNEVGLLVYSNNHFSEIKHQKIKQAPIDVIVTQEQLYQLVKQEYFQIKDKLIDISTYELVSNLYRALLSTQTFRRNLRLDKINYDILRQEEIQILEQLLRKYAISFQLEITHKEFCILILSMIQKFQKQGKRIGDIIKLQVSQNYSRLI